MRAVRAERGQVTVMALGLALVAFAVAGLATDGTRAFLLRRTLQNAADSAALAGASELDTDLYYSSGGTETVLDPARARVVALEWLGRRGLTARSAITATPTEVSVSLRDELRTAFLGLVGIDRIPVAVIATARPFAGSA
jgi:Flp pilus assembly protein TadG